MPESWRRLVFRVDGNADRLTAALWEHGTLGLELADERTVVAYFDRDTDLAVDWAACGARVEADELCRSQDWMSAYRAASRPLPIGERLVVDPREPEQSEAEGANWPGRWFRVCPPAPRSAPAVTPRHGWRSSSRRASI